MNKLLWICHRSQVVEVVASDKTALRLSKWVEVVEIETVKSRPLSFRVISDKWLCNWLDIPYEGLKN
jgi:hypothetical protein